MSLLLRHAARGAILLATFIGVALAADTPAEKTPEQVLSELLTSHRSELTLCANDGHRSYDGIVWLDVGSPGQGVLVDDAVLHDGNAIADADRLFKIMRDEDG